MSVLEFRYAGQVRMTPGGRTLIGLAAPFDRVARIGGAGGFDELIRPGAFRASLNSGGDCAALKDHDGGALLGRTRSGSLQLTETPAGLAFVLDVASTAAGDDVVALAGRGELAGCSIGFRIAKNGETWASNTRTLSAVDLHHVAIITGGDPAYGGTSASLRHQAGRQPSAATLQRRAWLATL